MVLANKSQKELTTTYSHKSDLNSKERDKKERDKKDKDKMH